MTDHSIAELKRQLDVAESASHKANVRVRDARAAYNAALCAEKVREFEAMGGVLGKTKVRTEGYWRGRGAPDMKSGPYFVIGAKVRFSSVGYVLASIKKDGTASAAPVGANPNRVFILAEDNA